MTALTCPHCGEPISGGDKVQYLAGEEAPSERSTICRHLHRLIHAECLFRMILGGVNHQARRCHCFGGTEPPDPEGMTKREAARAAAAYGEKARGNHLGEDGGSAETRGGTAGGDGGMGLDKEARDLLGRIRDLALKPYPFPPDRKFEDDNLPLALGMIAGLAARVLAREGVTTPPVYAYAFEGLFEPGVSTNGQAMSGGLYDATPLYVRLHSLDESREHLQMSALDGKRVRILIEVLPDPIEGGP